MDAFISFATRRAGAGLTLADVPKEFGASPGVARDWEDRKAQPRAHVIRSLDLIGSLAGHPAACTEAVASKDQGRTTQNPADPRAARTLDKGTPMSQTSNASPDSLIKSKQRVADHGEVFTPSWLVEKMLDLVKGESERINSRFSNRRAAAEFLGADPATQIGGGRAKLR